MPNVPIRATGGAMPSVSRRQFLRTTASAGIATAAAGGALVLHVTDMAEASPVADLLLDLVQRYEAETDRWMATHHATDEEGDADAQLMDELFFELQNNPPRATTMAGVIAALRLVHTDMAGLADGGGGIGRPLVGAAIAFLHGEAVR